MLLADIRKKSFKDYQSLIPLFPDAKWLAVRNEINRNDCAFYKICTFTSKECINSCKCVNTLFDPIQPIRGHCFKHHTTPHSSRLVGSEPSVLSIKVILQSCKNPLCSSEWKYLDNSSYMCSSPRCAFLSLSL